MWPNEQTNPAAAIPVYVVTPPATKADNFPTNGSAQIWPTAGVLTTVTVGTAGTGSTLALYDGTSASDTLLTTIDTSNQVSLTFNIPFSVGLFGVAAGAVAADVTICFV